MVFNRAEWKRNFRLARIAKGVCTRCGKSPPAEGSLDCPECKLKVSEFNRRYSRAKRIVCRASGICIVCMKRVAQTSQVVCGYCAEQNDEYAARKRGKK